MKPFHAWKDEQVKEDSNKHGIPFFRAKEWYFKAYGDYCDKQRVVGFNGLTKEETDNSMSVRGLSAAITKEASKEYAWECNQCGAQEYTMCVSETDVHELGCGSCGGDEWHKEETRK